MNEEGEDVQRKSDEGIREEYPTCVKSMKDSSQIIVGSSVGKVQFVNVSTLEVEEEILAHE